MSETTRTEHHERPELLLRMGLDLVALGKGDLALELARKAVADCPADPLIHQIASTILCEKVPDFHAGMLNDHQRNAAFHRAIAAAAPNRRVLDIGTGTGLLAMMAARAGATHVYACEANPQLAVTAREIVAANGLSDKITIIPKHSTQLDKDRDIGGGAELVVAEIFSANLVGEKALPALAHARAHLCLDNALFIPQAGAVKVALAEFGEPLPAVGLVEGFNLSLFNRHLPKTRLIAPSNPALQLRSLAAGLFRFDYAATTPPTASSAVHLRSTGGLVNGIVQWLSLEFASTAATGESCKYENSPGSDGSVHWNLCFHALQHPVQTKPGDVLVVNGWRTDTTLHIWTPETSPQQ